MMPKFRFKTSKPLLLKLLGSFGFCFFIHVNLTSRGSEALMGRAFSCSHSSLTCWAERLLGFETRFGLG